MTEQNINKRIRYSISLVRQGRHNFLSLTMPSDVLARTCFVTTREEDPQLGFQRVLDRNRAEQIAEYIDNGFGTIPNSIVLSAQPEAELRVIGGGKTMEFNDTPKAFLILDGQHRVYGFSLAKTALRVPVVIYNNLSRKDETRLFIDINTKQRPVPNELLLDIKKLAEYESDTEQRLGELFDIFNYTQNSPLLGLLSAATKESKKISRVTFNSALKPLIVIFKDNDVSTIYEALSSYLSSFIIGMSMVNAEPSITNPTVFRAVMQIFPEVARRVKDRHGSDYTQDHFFEILEPMFSRIKTTTFTNAGSSIQVLKDSLLKALRSDYSL